MVKRDEALSGLEARLGYSFNDPALLDVATTHASVGEGARNTRTGKLRDNERLEFLGDRVLGLVIAEALLARDPNAREGEMAVQLAALVSGRTCARVARTVDLGEALRLAAGETKTGGRDKDTILGGACEAVIAALYLDGGLGAAQDFILRAWVSEIETADAVGAEHPKTALQNWTAAQGRGLPRYSIIARSGPDHAPRFRVAVNVEGLAPVEAEGASRQAAERAAAQALLAREKPS